MLWACLETFLHSAIIIHNTSIFFVPDLCITGSKCLSITPVFEELSGSAPVAK